VGILDGLSDWPEDVVQEQSSVYVHTHTHTLLDGWLSNITGYTVRVCVISAGGAKYMYMQVQY